MAWRFSGDSDILKRGSIGYLPSGYLGKMETLRMTYINVVDVISEFDDRRCDEADYRTNPNNLRLFVEVLTVLGGVRIVWSNMMLACGKGSRLSLSKSVSELSHSL